MKLHSINAIRLEIADILEEGEYIDQLIAGLYTGLKASVQYKELQEKKAELKRQYGCKKEFLRQMVQDGKILMDDPVEDGSGYAKKTATGKAIYDNEKRE